MKIIKQGHPTVAVYCHMDNEGVFSLKSTWGVVMMVRMLVHQESCVSACTWFQNISKALLLLQHTLVCSLKWEHNHRITESPGLEKTFKMEPNHQPDVLGTVPKPYPLMAPPPISLSMPRDGDSTSPLCSLPQYCRWGWKASSNNSSTGSHPTSGETGAQPRERNVLFSSFPCVSSISWTAKLRNGGKKKKVQEFLPLHSQAVGLVSS